MFFCIFSSPLRNQLFTGCYMHNQTEKKTIALLELGGSHVECLYAQVLFLQPTHEVHVICNRHLWPELAHMEGISGHQLHDTGGSRRQVIAQVKKYLKAHHIQYLVINTTEISLVRDLVLRLLFSRINITGIVHNARKLNNSFTMRKMTGLKVKKFFVLNDALLAHIHAAKGTAVSSFYPVFFPHTGKPLPKQEGECWVGVPGSIDGSRRDYTTLLEQIHTHGLPPDMKIIFLGGFYPERDPDIAARLNALPPDLRQQLVTFGPELVPQPVFDSWMRQTDVLLPLLHPGVHKFPEYLTTRISGAYNLSFGYQVPLLMEQSFSTWGDLAQHALFYAVPDLPAVLRQLAANPAPLHAKRAGIAADPKFSLAVQRARYLALAEQA